MSHPINNDDRLYQQLVEQFLVTYNQIDHFAREQKPESRSFMDAASSLLQLRGQKALEVELRQLNDLRNHLVHGQKSLRFRTAIPTPECVSRINQIRDILLRPGTAFAEFSCEVVKFDIHSSLSEVLEEMHLKDISQFPIYDKSEFKGVITERSLAKWISAHVSNELSLVDLEETKVLDVFKFSTHEQNYIFVSRDTPLWAVQQDFRNKTLLEAALITQNGKTEETPLGIVSRWDIFNLDINTTQVL